MAIDPTYKGSHCFEMSGSYRPTNTGIIECWVAKSSGTLVMHLQSLSFSSPPAPPLHAGVARYTGMPVMSPDAIDLPRLLISLRLTSQQALPCSSANTVTYSGVDTKRIVKPALSQSRRCCVARDTPRRARTAMW